MTPLPPVDRPAPFPFAPVAARRLARAVLQALPLVAALAGALVPLLSQAADAAPGSQDIGQRIEHGRYLVRLGGCNDCHTPGFAGAGGKVAEQDWLVGDRLGYSGPWGTTYPSNLRLLVAGLTEAQWVTMAQTREMRPPMPWFTLHQIKTDDLKAIYQYIASLGPKGEPAPAYLPPGRKPAGPVVSFPMPPAP